jgi:hypothetical protein
MIGGLTLLNEADETSAWATYFGILIGHIIFRPADKHPHKHTTNKASQ